MANPLTDGRDWRQGSIPGKMESSPGPPPGHARSKSAVMQSPLHSRNNSLADHSNGLTRSGSQSSTFAQKFIKHEGQLDGGTEVGGIEGENDFSGKRYVWVKDPKLAFVKGWIVEDVSDKLLKVQCDDGSVSLLDLMLHHVR